MDPNGIVIGVVIDLADPENLGRVRVKYPHLDDKVSNWARLVSPMAGMDRGFFFRPEVGDEVLVAFLQGNIRYPFVLGGLWNGEDMPPADDGKPKENNWRFIKSRSGHTVKLDDTMDKEKIEIIDAENKHKIVLDTANNKLQISCDVGDIELKAPNGTILLDARVIDMKSAENVSLEAGKDLEIKAPNGEARLEAQAIEITSGSSLELEAQSSAMLRAMAGVTVMSSGSTEVEGSIVHVKGYLINFN